MYRNSGSFHHQEYFVIYTVYEKLEDEIFLCANNENYEHKRYKNIMKARVCGVLDTHVRVVVISTSFERSDRGVWYVLCLSVIMVSFFITDTAY